MYKNSWLLLIGVILILAAVFVPTLSFDRMLRRDSDLFMTKINEICDVDDDNYVEINKKCKELESLWKEHMDHWSFVVHHSAIERIDLSITSFIEYAKSGERGSRDVEAKKIEKMLGITSRQDKLDLLNIL